MFDLKEEKDLKARRIFIKAAGVTGIGFGLFFVALIAPLIHNAPQTFDMQMLFVKYGLLIMAYTAAMVVTFIMMRKYMGVMNVLMQWVYLPTIVVLFGMEAYGIITRMTS